MYILVSGSRKTDPFNKIESFKTAKMRLFNAYNRKSRIFWRDLCIPFFFRWLWDTLKIGIYRELEEHEMYEVTKSLRSDKNTEEFAEQWDEELKTKSPSVLRVILKIHGFRLIFSSLLFSLLETSARWVMSVRWVNAYNAGAKQI